MGIGSMCNGFCLINSWVGLITLAVFAWVANKEPVLLEIYSHEKKVQSHAQGALLVSSIIYGVIAIALTILAFLTRSKSGTGSNRSSNSRGSRDTNQRTKKKSGTFSEVETVTLGASTKRNDTFGNGLEIDIDNASEKSDDIEIEDDDSKRGE